MKKACIALSLLLFFQFVLLSAYPAEIFLKDFALDRGNGRESGQTDQAFSLAEKYPSSLLLSLDAPALQAETKGAESLQAEIKALKKKRTTTYFGAGGTALLGGLLLYMGIKEKPSGRETQVGKSESALKSGGKIWWFAGAAISAGLSVILINSASRTGRAIREKEAELKKLQEAQEALARATAGY
jgi:hypothetical protein